jgi:hypothetical protein
MLLWSPKSNPNLTAFMPHVQSGGYFVVNAAYLNHGHQVVQVRVTSASDEYPINEFITFSSGKMQRIVRAMRDSHAGSSTLKAKCNHMRTLRRTRHGGSRTALCEKQSCNTFRHGVRQSQKQPSGYPLVNALPSRHVSARMAPNKSLERTRGR